MIQPEPNSDQLQLQRTTIENDQKKMKNIQVAGWCSHYTSSGSRTWLQIETMEPPWQFEKTSLFWESNKKGTAGMQGMIKVF